MAALRPRFMANVKKLKVHWPVLVAPCIISLCLWRIYSFSNLKLYFALTFAPLIYFIFFHFKCTKGKYYLSKNTFFIYQPMHNEVLFFNKQACCAGCRRRLQEQTLPDATQPIGKINHSSKMVVNFEPLMSIRI